MRGERKKIGKLAGTGVNCSGDMDDGRGRKGAGAEGKERSLVAMRNGEEWLKRAAKAGFSR